MQIPDWIERIKNPELQGDAQIPIYAPVFHGNEKKYVMECIDESWISPKGSYVQRLEEMFASFCGTKYALACASGTAAIQLSLLVAGIGKGDEVILPTNTMISTALAVTYVGATPVFIGCMKDNGTLSIETLEKTITARTKAIIPVHLYGMPPDLDTIHTIAKAHNLIVIEDAAEAIGSTYKGKKVGSISPLNAFSMYINKIITTGQGGMITTDSEAYYRELKQLNNYYFSPVRHFWHEKIGYNLKMTNMQAAVGVAQMEKIDWLLSRKLHIANRYGKNLANLKNIFSTPQPTDGAMSNTWMVAYYVKDQLIESQELRDYLAQFGIETRSFFIPLHLQPCYQQPYIEGKYPNAEYFARYGVLIPSGPGLSDDQIDMISEKILHFFKSVHLL